jgi:hypothetical protein
MDGSARPTFDDGLEWIGPVRIEGPRSFNLIVVWAKNHRAKVFHPMEPRKRQTGQATVTYRAFIQERDTD